MHTTDKLKELEDAAFCTGCEYRANEPLGLNKVQKPYLACCPDNNYVVSLNLAKRLLTTIEPEKEVSAEKAADIKAKEFFEGVLNMDWMSEEEKQTIYDATELYAQGRVRYASLVSKKEVGEGKDLDVSLGNSGNASVASHNSSSSNTNEQ
jgi:hypothetical protein